MQDTDQQEPLLALLPRSKQDLDRARALVELGYPAVEPVLPQILKWIQDSNWPVARVLLPLLVSIGEPLAPHARRVVLTDDAMWKYWLLTDVVGCSPELARALREDVERLAASSSTDEDELEVTSAARAVLVRLQIAPRVDDPSGGGAAA